MTRLLLTALIDTYNHERFIAEAIESALAQDFPASETEILVVDDGSTDRTPEIVRKFVPRVRLLEKQNGGQASAFNAAIPEAGGELVAFLDGDDWWATHKLSAIVEAFASHPPVGLVGNSITEVLLDGARRSELIRGSQQFRIDGAEGARRFRVRKNFLGSSRMAFRAELLRRIGPVPAALVIEADEYLFTLGALFSEVLLLPEPLTFYRIHEHNLYQSTDGSPRSLLRKREVLTVLARELPRRFAEEKVPEEVCRIILEPVENEADALGCVLGEGSRLLTFSTELRKYRIHNEQESLARRLFKYVSLLPAFVLPPGQYHRFKHKLNANSLYVRGRQWILPSHPPAHVDRAGDWQN